MERPVTKPQAVHAKASSVSCPEPDDDSNISATSPPQPEVPEDAEPEYPDAKQAAIVVVALILAVFLIAFDRTIIATAIPQISDEFDSLKDIGWYGSAYMLTMCAFQLFMGRMYTFYPPKYVFLTVIGIFEIGSTICGAAPNSIAFIIGRAIAGLGSAGVTNGGIILLVTTLPLEKRPFYQGFFGAALGLASTAGPLVGGAFTTNVSWRWCFLINLPIGGVAIAILVLILKPTRPQNPNLTFRQQLAKLDLIGQLCLMPSVICLLLALQWGGSVYIWSSWRIIVLFTVFAVLAVAFVLSQILQSPQVALIPGSIIKNRSVVAGMWVAACLAWVMMMFVYYVPIWFQAIKGVSAVHSGIDMIPLVLSQIVGGILAGQVTGRIGYYTPSAIACTIMMPIGAGLITTWNPDTSSSAWIGFQVLLGIGIGFGMQQPSMAAQTVLSKKDVPMGVSLMFFSQMLSGAIAVSVGENVLNSNLVAGLASVVKNFRPSDVLQSGATGLRSAVPASELGAVLLVYNSALKHVFVVAVVVASLTSLGAFGLEWKSVKKQPQANAKKSQKLNAAEKSAEDV